MFKSYVGLQGFAYIIAGLLSSCPAECLFLYVRVKYVSFNTRMYKQGVNIDCCVQ